MRYFTNCKTAEELRKEFHRLAKELHPDNGGNAEDFKAMKAEFEKALETVLSCPESTLKALRS